MGSAIVTMKVSSPTFRSQPILANLFSFQEPSPLPMKPFFCHAVVGVDFAIGVALGQVIAHFALSLISLPEPDIIMPGDFPVVHGILFLLGDGIAPQFAG